MPETPKSPPGAMKKTEDKEIERNMPPPSGLPLAAKDSEWIGFKTNYDRSTENAASLSPNLFPGVNFDDKTQSTTVITRQLVGKKADFTRLQSKPTKFIKSNVYASLPEEPSEADLSSAVKSDQEYKSCSDMDYDDDDDEKEPQRSMHVKRRKRRSDIKAIEQISSVSITAQSLAERRKTSSKIIKVDSAAIHARNAYKAASILLSYEADDADKSQSDDTPDCHSSQSALIKSINNG